MFHFMLRMTINRVLSTTLPSFDQIIDLAKNGRKTRQMKRRGPRHARVVIR